MEETCKGRVDPRLDPWEGGHLLLLGQEQKHLQGLGLTRWSPEVLLRGVTYLYPPSLPERGTGQSAPWLGFNREGHEDSVTSSYSGGPISSLMHRPETILEVLRNYPHFLSSLMRLILLSFPFYC